MKKLALIAAVVFTTLTLQSCRQSDEVMSPDEILTLQKVQDSSNNILKNNTSTSLDNGEVILNSVVDGELLPPPKK